MIHGLKVEEVMTKTLVTIKPLDTVKHAEELMNLHGIRHLPVMDGVSLVGLVSDRDIKKANFFQGPGDLRAEEVMSTDLTSAPRDAFLTDVVYAMLLKKINAIPVLSENGELCGIFTSYDLMRVVLDYAMEEEERIESLSLLHFLPAPEGQSVEWKLDEPVQPERLEIIYSSK